MTNMTPDKHMLLEMWRDHQYVQVGELVSNSGWTHGELLQFAAFFCKHMGVSQLHVLYKFV